MPIPSLKTHSSTMSISNPSSQLIEGKEARPSANDSVCVEDEIQMTGIVPHDTSNMVPIPIQRVKSTVVFDVEEITE